MYNRLRMEHGAYGIGIYLLPDAPLATSRVLMNSCCLAHVTHDAKLVERAHTHKLSWSSTITAVGCVARDDRCATGCNLGFRNLRWSSKTSGRDWRMPRNLRALSHF